jgi:hypothetical protein
MRVERLKRPSTAMPVECAPDKISSKIRRRDIDEGGMISPEVPELVARECFVPGVAACWRTHKTQR